MITKLFMAGSGGQGTLAIGLMMAKAAMEEGKEVTWLPSYGPEMRGGTANCTVVISDRPISCPLINEADLLVVMNLPSLTRFESLVRPGGTLMMNSSLIKVKPTRTDIRVGEVPASALAQELGSERAANMVMLGAVVKETGLVMPENIREQLEHTFTGQKAQFLPMNLKAFSYYSE